MPARNPKNVLRQIAVLEEGIRQRKRWLEVNEPRLPNAVIAYVSDPSHPEQAVLRDRIDHEPEAEWMRKIVTYDGRTYFWSEKWNDLFSGNRNVKRRDAADGNRAKVFVKPCSPEDKALLLKALLREHRRAEKAAAATTV